MERMPDRQMVKKIMESEAVGRRNRGGPKTRWVDGVSSGLRERGLTLEQGRVRARDRNAWRRMMDG